MGCVPTNLRAPDLHSCSTTRSVAVFPPAPEASRDGVRANGTAIGGLAGARQLGHRVQVHVALVEGGPAGGEEDRVRQRSVVELLAAVVLVLYSTAKSPTGGARGGRAPGPSVEHP